MTTGDRHSERVRAAYQRYDTLPAEQRKRDAENPGNALIARDRQAGIERALTKAFPHGFEFVRALDVGCGRGALLGLLQERGARPANLHGLDLLEDRIADAKRVRPDLDLRAGDARHLPFEDRSFDLVVCSTLFSSVVESEVAEQIATEVCRVLDPTGAILWYDVRLPNPGNSNTIAMSRARIRALFPGFSLELRPATLLPPLARRLGPLTGAAYPLLAALPFLRSHYLGVLRHA